MTSVFVLVDALGWELVKDRAFLEDELPFRRPLDTVFGFSSGAIPSILTGRLPDGHGHWNLFLYRPETSPFRWTAPLARLPSSWINHRAVRKAVALIGKRLSGSNGYFSIYGVPVELLRFFDICEKQDIYRPGGLAPARSVFDELADRGVPYRVYNYHQYDDRSAVRQMIRDLKSRAARFYFLYLCELDAFLHDHIQSAEAVTREIEQYGDLIRQLYRAVLASDPDATFYVFSDHGMTPVESSFDLMSAVRSLGFREPQDYLALYDSTMARFWFFREECRRAVAALLERLPCGRLVRPEERKQLGIAFPDDRFGELIFAMRPGCVIHPSYMGGNRWKGMHGFDPEHPTSRAAFLARREPPIAVQHIRDLYYLMLREAGL
jgi:predicted AlkP superfamily pyrophosphatase or phosphodiesterase